MFEGVSFDGGKTWTTKLIGLGAGDPLGDACCDPSLSFDQFRYCGQSGPDGAQNGGSSCARHRSADHALRSAS
jgi:hypothetical protein